MIILGLILLIVGYLLSIPLLTTAGIILLIVGAVLALVGSVGHHPIGGRQHYY